MNLRPLLLSAFLALGVLTNACSSSSPSSSSSGSTCTDTFNTLCEQACSCGGSTSCTLVEMTDAGAGASITFAGLNDCETLYALTCGMTGGVREGFDYGACSTAASSAACVSASGTSGKGAAYPAVCNPNATSTTGASG